MTTGKKVHQKIVIFESDDWGSNRIASKEDYEKLIKEGILTDNCSVYDKCDTIARPKDLELLFEVLSSVKDSEGHNAIITPFFTPVNPDFDKIRNSNYTVYYYETFLQTLAKQGLDREVLNLWKQGIDSNLIDIEYHGREHLCVPLWMQYLQGGKGKEAFKYHFYTIHDNFLPHVVDAFRPTLYFNDEDQKLFLGKTISEGLDILNETLNAKPFVFAPANGVSHSFFDEILAQKGIILIHNSKRFEPDGHGGGMTVNIRSMKNEFGQFYYNRNCLFEPVQVSYDPVDFCLAQIEGAFNWHKAAIISTHRVNYIGSIIPKNRELGLSQLERLLKAIIVKWPDVVFKSSKDYAKMIKDNE